MKTIRSEAASKRQFVRMKDARQMLSGCGCEFFYWCVRTVPGLSIRVNPGGARLYSLKALEAILAIIDGVPVHARRERIRKWIQDPDTHVMRGPFWRCARCDAQEGRVAP